MPWSSLTSSVFPTKRPCPSSIPTSSINTRRSQMSFPTTPSWSTRCKGKNVTRQVYTANDITYTVAMDDRVPPGLRPMALVRAVLVDELTGQPPRGSITLATNQRGLSPRVADDGLIGWAGIPREAFSSLRLQNYDFHGTVDAARYVPLDLPI